MYSILIVKIIIFVAAIVASRYLLKKIPNYLSEEQQNLVAEKSSSISLMRNVLIYGAAIFLFLSGRIAPENVEMIKMVVLAVLIIGMSLVVFLSYRKFNELNLPTEARNFYVWSVIITLVGIGVLFAPIEFLL